MNASWWAIIRLFFNGKCESCNREAPIENSKRKFVIHHRDGNQNNNALSNLWFLCKKCHGKEHSLKRRMIHLKNRVKRSGINISKSFEKQNISIRDEAELLKEVELVIEQIEQERCQSIISKYG